MSFQSPVWLWALLVIAPLALAALAWSRAGARAGRLWSDPAVMAVGPTGRTRAWRAGALALALLAVASGVVAMARPSVDDTVDERRSSVMITLDVSESMTKTDLSPTRLAAALDAARRFAGAAPAETAIGLTTFADNTSVVLEPTTDRERLRSALDGITETRVGTALGAAVTTSLAALDAAGAVADPPPSDPSDSPARILVLTDGANSIGAALAATPEEAAERAAAAGVPIYTILLGDDPGRPDQPLPAETLAGMSTRTGGVFAQSTSSADLVAVFTDIGAIIAPVPTERELTVWAAAAAIALLALAALLAGLGRPRTVRLEGAGAV
jgi:Ca-activated chloride channel family protein